MDQHSLHVDASMNRLHPFTVVNIPGMICSTAVVFSKRAAGHRKGSQGATVVIGGIYLF